MIISSVVRLKKGREFSVNRFHPWIFSGALESPPTDLKDGSWVEVQDYRKEAIAFGHYQKGSITIRILSFGKARPADDFWRAKLETALSVRQGAAILSETTNCFRLVHGEGDGLPGLVIDYYHGAAIVQAHSVGMVTDRHEIATALRQLFGSELKAVYFKSAAKETTTEGEYLFGMEAVPHIVQEHGQKFYVDWEGGQKTGFFLDQRENRKLLGQYSKGRKVLNTFCYTGGFSVYALAHDAEIVHSVDASEKAIDLTRKNLELNGFNSNLHASYAEDTFDFLKRRETEYDLIVLDPPAFAKHKDARHQAMKGYQRLNAEAMKVIKPGGILFTFSCSQVVDRQLFYDTVVSAAIQTGRDIKVLHHLSQPADHPVSMYHPEGEYLKGLVLYVG